MKVLRCWCGQVSMPNYAIPQTREKFENGVDTYICLAGHVFEAPVPFKLKDGFAIRGDM